MKLLNYSQSPVVSTPQGGQLHFGLLTVSLGLHDTQVLGTISVDVNDPKSIARQWRIMGKIQLQTGLLCSKRSSKIPETYMPVKHLSDVEKFSRKISKTYNLFNRKRSEISKLPEFPEFKQARFEKLKSEMQEVIATLEKRYDCKLSEYLYDSAPNLNPIK